MTNMYFRTHVSENELLQDQDNMYEEEESSEEYKNNNETAQRPVQISNNSIITLNKRVIRGKNKHCWFTTKRSTIPTMNIIHASKGSTRITRNLLDPLSCFNNFITEDIVNEIVKWTNVEIQKKREDINEPNKTFSDMTFEEMRALIGILVLTAVLKDNHLSAMELFDSEVSGSRYVAIMSRERFKFLIRCLRMDDESLRRALRQEDAFVPIRNIWEMFINRCRISYSPGDHVTIDEQLMGFRGRCPFRMYIPNKPNKYGIKFPMMCDSTTKYMIDAIPYLGKCTKTNNMPLEEYFTKELSKSIHGSWRNVTVDNWFTSVPLAKSLLVEPYKLTLVGTIRSNKREIPREMKEIRSRPVGSSMFCYDGPLTLLSYKAKTSKMVYLLSSCNEEGTVNKDNEKPEMILYYNQTKGGVNTFNQMCSSMSCNRKTNRWPMAVFYGMLNMAFVNSYIIYYHNVMVKNERPLNRRNFMKRLSKDLTTTWIENRLKTTTTFSHKLRENIENALHCSLSTSSRLEKIRRMTKSNCDKCGKALCGEHKIELCHSCI